MNEYGSVLVKWKYTQSRTENNTWVQSKLLEREPTRTERLQSRWRGVNRPLSLKDFRRRLKATSKIPHGDGKTFSTYLDTITLGGPLYSVITAHAFALLGIINDDDEVRFALPVSQSEHAGSYKFFKQSIGLNFDQANSYMTTLAKKYENTVMDLPEPSVERFEMTACKISITAVGTDFQSLAAPQKITRIELPTLMPGAAKKSTKPIDTASEGIDSLFAKELTRGLFFHKTLPSDKTLQERRQKGEDGRVNKTAVKKFEKAYMAKCKASFDAWKDRLLTIPDPKGTVGCTSDCGYDTHPILLVVLLVYRTKVDDGCTAIYHQRRVLGTARAVRNSVRYQT